MTPDQELADAIAGFYQDPLGFVMFAYEWDTDREIQVCKLQEPWASRFNCEYGPDKWACEFLDELGQKIKDNDFNGRDPVSAVRMARASGHGVGKAQGYSSVIPTPSGLSRWGDIHPGAFVLGSDGLAAKVIARHEHGVKDLYRVMFDDGSSECVCLDHLWTVMGRQERRTGSGWVTISTADLLNRGVKRSNGKALCRQFEIPTCSPVNFNHKSVFSPYCVGVWLGDGSSGSGVICSSFDEIWARLPGTVNPPTYSAVAGGRYRIGTVSGLWSALKSAGMVGVTCDTKLVGDVYKFNSVDVRMDLLSGLLDTDGEVHKSGSAGYSSTSKQLVDDIIWLARSLGAKAMMQPTVKKTGYRDSDGNMVRCKDLYRCTINLPWNPFTVKHKKDSFKISEARYQKRWIDSIEFSHREKAMCITVDAPDGLYLASDFIVTHNSAMVGWLANFIMSTRPNSQGTVTANTSTQLNTKTWPQIVKWTKKCITSHWFRLTSGQGSMMMAQVDSPKTWFCSAQTCKKENSEAFAGQHAPTATSFYIFDEGSAVEDIIYEVAEGGLTDGEPMEFVFGNPTKNRGRFYDIFKKLTHRWSVEQIDSRDAQLPNKEFIEELIEDHGVDSDFVKVRVRGMFPSMSAKQFISVEDVDKAYGKHLREDQYKFAPKILTCDPAWMGDDLLTVGLRQGLSFKILRTLPKNDNDVQVASMLANLEDEHGADSVFIDGGWGTGIYSAGKTMGRPHWRLVWSAEKSPDAGCLNMRAYMIKQTRDWLKEGGAIPKVQRLYDDLITPEAVPRLDGKIQIESKKDMKARGMPSTDYLDILGLSFAFPTRKVDSRSLSKRLRENIDYGANVDPFDSL